MALERKSYLFLIMAICLMHACAGSEEVGNHIGTASLCDSIHVERFYLSMGVHAGGAQTYFVTDSATYRFCIGVCDDKEFLATRIEGSTLVVQKHSRRNLKDGASTVIDTETFDLP